VAAGRYVTGQKFSGSQASSGPAGLDRNGRARAGFNVGSTGAWGRDHGEEPDHVPGRLPGPGPSQNTFVSSSNRARVWSHWGDDDLYPCVESFSTVIESEMLKKPL
jgi:hypothetical protein